MTTETQRPYDVLLSDGKPGGKLKNVGTAWPTPKGAGYRFTLKANLAEGAQVVLLPQRSRRNSDRLRKIFLARAKFSLTKCSSRANNRV